jgi:hypothetical protein
MSKARSAALGEPETDPTRRRWMLLARAMEEVPLAQALELAERAEFFVANGITWPLDEHNPSPPAAPPLEGDEKTHISADGHEPSPSPAPPLAADQKAKAEKLRSPGKPRSFQPIPKDLVMARLAQGASNAEIAAETGLTQRQIQGFRLQMGRPTSDAVTEEIVRYLRQQGDVVVSDAEGRFIVNGGSRLSFQELADRANRMRSRAAVRGGWNGSGGARPVAGASDAPVGC